MYCHEWYPLQEDHSLATAEDVRTCAYALCESVRLPWSGHDLRGARVWSVQYALHPKKERPDVRANGCAPQRVEVRVQKPFSRSLLPKSCHW